jgi:hypothetical protein
MLHVHSGSLFVLSPVDFSFFFLKKTKARDSQRGAVMSSLQGLIPTLSCLRTIFEVKGLSAQEDNP